jgi:hypothetical protein
MKLNLKNYSLALTSALLCLILLSSCSKSDTPTPPASPTVSNVTPAIAAEGTDITITGTNFDATAANDIVSFIPNAGSTVTGVVKQASATQLTVTVPSAPVASYTISVGVTKNGSNLGPASWSGSFTLGGVPILQNTTAATSINEISAASGGFIISNAGFSITASGICWNTTGSPTITDSHTQDGTAVGPYPSNLTGLAPGTLYHVRSYATNSAGTGYGNEVTFTTSSLVVPTGLLAFYKFNGNVVDYSGKGNDLTATSVTYTSDRNSNANSSANFDGTASKAIVSLDLKNSTSVTVSLWFYGISPNLGSQTMLWTSDYAFRVYDGYNNTAANDVEGLGQELSSSDIATVPLVSRNSWHHLVGIYDGANAVVSLYIDNVVVGSKSISAVLSHSLEQWNIGVFNNGGGNSYWIGYIDNLRIYNRALAASEVGQLYLE